jgi:hypothetical protein
MIATVTAPWGDASRYQPYVIRSEPAQNESFTKNSMSAGPSALL